MSARSVFESAVQAVGPTKIASAQAAEAARQVAINPNSAAAAAAKAAALDAAERAAQATLAAARDALRTGNDFSPF